MSEETSRDSEDRYLVGTFKAPGVLLDADLYQALLAKARETDRTITDLVDEAVRYMLREDQVDLAAFDERANEPTISYEELLKDLRAHGKI